MPTPAQIKQAVDDKLLQLWAAIQSKEDDYASSHRGRYWQGLITHSVLPADGISTLPDVGTKAPTDQPAPWPLALRNTTMPMAIIIDVYDGPLGVGYQATVKVIVAGTIWARTAQVGPENYRTQGWREVTAQDLI